MEYSFSHIERKWQQRWREQQTYAVHEDPAKTKYYVLDMFPYPSGAGLHVGHPLGYIASDIIARYKRLQGFNVLHPMGYDSFGLPAEQYAIQTGQHPEITTETNIKRYREQLDKIGFAYDWSREVRTSSPEYYRWTQWIFGLIFNSWYNLDLQKAEPISTLVDRFKSNGTYGVRAAQDPEWFKEIPTEKFFFGKDFQGEFTATDWQSMNETQQEIILMHYRMAYLADSVVNWCPALGTVLANDEIKDGVSERGGHPVEQKKMRQWSMRISAYSERLLEGLNSVDWNDSIKEIQRNWIGRSEGASVRFAVQGHEEEIEVFTTRPDTLFGVSFMTLAPEHPLVDQITTDEFRTEVENYIEQTKLKTERDRQSEVKNISGQFTGAFAIHPFTGTPIPIWVGDYVLAGYGTGAVMAVPCGDQRDFDFARKFNLPIPNIFKDTDISEKAEASKDAVLKDSQMLDGHNYASALPLIISELEKRGIGKGKVNYRMRDAVFSRQRYWGEPFPVFYDHETPKLVADHDLPVVLPEVDKYLPTESGEPPLARAKDWGYTPQSGAYAGRFDFNTMPGWAGSSWYFIRYMDPNNSACFADRSNIDYWNQVDLYMGGAEHATGHLLYARFWTKILFDLGYIGFDEPFKKMINQGMILGRSSHVYRIMGTNTFVTAEKKDDYETQQLYVDIHLVDADVLDTERFKKWLPEYENAEFILNDQGKYTCTWAIDKMSKRWFNVANPDDLCEKFGADTLRLFEMFLGPVEQSKPWDTKSINGVHNFLRKFWRLTHDDANEVSISEEAPTKAELKSLHKTIKKITEDLNRYSWNTCVSAFMICLNELQESQCNKREVIEPLLTLLCPFAPHFCEELWEQLGHTTSITQSSWPKWNEDFLEDDAFNYPISFNGKTRFFLSLPATWAAAEIETAVRQDENTAKFMEGKSIKKVVVVPKRIVNVVI